MIACSSILFQIAGLAYILAASAAIIFAVVKGLQQ